MKIKGIGFLYIISQHILFDIGSMIKNRKIKNTKYGIKQAHKLWLQRGFKNTSIHAASEFEPLQVDMTDIGISLNCMHNKEHVSTIEQLNQTFKERVKSDQAAMPFKKISELMIVHLVATAIFG